MRDNSEMVFPVPEGISNTQCPPASSVSVGMSLTTAHLTMSWQGANTFEIAHIASSTSLVSIENSLGKICANEVNIRILF